MQAAQILSFYIEEDSQRFIVPLGACNGAHKRITDLLAKKRLPQQQSILLAIGSLCIQHGKIKRALTRAPQGQAACPGLVADGHRPGIASLALNGYFKCIQLLTLLNFFVSGYRLKRLGMMRMHRG
jgi:hypothetical protein